jgi:hypothetical protein
MNPDIVEDEFGDEDKENESASDISAIWDPSPEATCVKNETQTPRGVLQQF